MRPVGYRALESLRLEKGYRAWGSDITPNDTPFEAGLGWAVKLKKDTPFMGRAALEAASNRPQKKALATFTTEREDIVLLGRETILRDGAVRRLPHLAAAMATRSASRSGWAMCASPTASPTSGSGRAATNWWWRARPSRRRCTSTRSTTRRAHG